MNLKIILPFEIFAEKNNVARIVVNTTLGSFGILPHRLDCVAALAPGILTYAVEGEEEVFVAVDGGIMIKTETDVVISARNAIGGADLEQLHTVIEREFLNLSDKEQKAHAAMVKMENGFIQRLAALNDKY